MEQPDWLEALLLVLNAVQSVALAYLANCRRRANGDRSELE